MFGNHANMDCLEREHHLYQATLTLWSTCKDRTMHLPYPNTRLSWFIEEKIPVPLSKGTLTPIE